MSDRPTLTWPGTGVVLVWMDDDHAKMTIDSGNPAIGGYHLTVDRVDGRWCAQFYAPWRLGQWSSDPQHAIDLIHAAYQRKYAGLACVLGQQKGLGR